MDKDVKTVRFIDAIENSPGCIVALSALLTTTMVHMETIVREIRAKYPETIFIIGGAPV
ncbi:MAG: cobalamin-dependent protein [Methanococcaceae archaeon]